MNGEKLIYELFVNHWLATTLFAPSLTFLYAWVTDSTAWWIASLFLALAYFLIPKS